MNRIFLFVVLALGFCGPALAQVEPQKVAQLESRVSTLEEKIRNLGDAGLVLFLFGAFCALWAQNSGRSGWLWFFLGLFFSVITVLVLLSKNSIDRDEERRNGRRKFDLNDFRQQ
ncbi:MAG: hypothetical protein ABIZ04_04115 [Opitutus sp.]